MNNTTTKLEKLVYKMLTTNTGIHMMDSGGEEGRGWQRNQKKTIEDFKNEPAVALDYDFREWNTEKGEWEEVKEIDSTEIPIYVSLFKYMTSGILELDSFCNEFNRKAVNDWDSEIYGVSKSGEKWIKKYFEIGDSWNTYNGEELISQTVQGADLLLPENSSNFEYPDYVLLQIHNGADVRGGYTDAKLFRVEGDYFTATPYIYGDIDGVEVSTQYDSLTLRDENDKSVKVKKDSKVNLYLTE